MRHDGCRNECDSVDETVSAAFGGIPTACKFRPRCCLWGLADIPWRLSLILVRRQRIRLSVRTRPFECRCPCFKFVGGGDMDMGTGTNAWKSGHAHTQHGSEQGAGYVSAPRAMHGEKYAQHEPVGRPRMSAIIADAAVCVLTP